MILFVYILLSCVLNVASSILIWICKTISFINSHEIKEITKQNISVSDFCQISLDNNRKMSVQGEKENNGSSGLKGNEGEPGVFNQIVIYQLKKKLNSVKF